MDFKRSKTVLNPIFIYWYRVGEACCEICLQILNGLRLWYLWTLFIYKKILNFIPGVCRQYKNSVMFVLFVPTTSLKIEMMTWNLMWCYLRPVWGNRVQNFFKSLQFLSFWIWLFSGTPANCFWLHISLQHFKQTLGC